MARIQSELHEGARQKANRRPGRATRAGHRRHVLPGGPAGFTRVQMTLTADQVEQLEAQGCIVKRLPDPGQA